MLRFNCLQVFYKKSAATHKRKGIKIENQKLMEELQKTITTKFEKRITITNTFQKSSDESSFNLGKVLIDKGRKQIN